MQLYGMISNQYWGFHVSFGEIVVVFLTEADSIENASLFFVQITQ